MRIHRLLSFAVVFLFLIGLGFGQSKSRTEHYAFSFSVTGQNLGSCDGFDVLTDYVILARGDVLLNKEGQPVREGARYKAIGQSVYYNSTDSDLFLLGAPGEIEVDHFDYVRGIVASTGPSWKIKVPGYGLIYAETGRAVIDLTTGEVLSNTGHNQFFDKDLEAVCKFLTPVP